MGAPASRPFVAFGLSLAAELAASQAPVALALRQVSEPSPTDHSLKLAGRPPVHNDFLRSLNACY
jgi:hypothetical protein